jgi:hypothetical protein
MAKKKLKSAVWHGYTAEEQRAMSLIHRHFGTVTHITLEKFKHPWQRVDGASTDRCPECMTYWNPKTYPKCGWCGEKAS